MDKTKRKELMEAYKNRRPDMGVVAIRCLDTGDTFFGASKDTKADINSNRFKLESGSHRNTALRKLWEQYGAGSFEFYVSDTLEYDDETEDYSDKLEALLVRRLEATPGSTRIWK